MMYFDNNANLCDITWAIACYVSSKDDFESFKKEVEIESDLESSVHYVNNGIYFKVFEDDMMFNKCIDNWVHESTIKNFDTNNLYKKIYERTHNEI